MRDREAHNSVIALDVYQRERKPLQLIDPRAVKVATPSRWRFRDSASRFAQFVPEFFGRHVTVVSVPVKRSVGFSYRFGMVFKLKI
jgi:hypothetical protein